MRRRSKNQSIPWVVAKLRSQLEPFPFRSCLSFLGTMRRKAWFRSLATLLAMWLPLIAGEPGLLQPCPMHGAGRAVLASLRGEPIQAGMIGAPAPTHSSSHSHHAAASTSAESDRSTPAPGHDHHKCTCIDGCTATAVAFVAPAVPTAEFIVAEYAAASTISGVESLARPAPEFSRPYTTGPPRA